jgi:hypothetical protein
MDAGSVDMRVTSGQVRTTSVSLKDEDEPICALLDNIALELVAAG